MLYPVQEKPTKVKNDWEEVVPVRGMRRTVGPGMAKIVRSGKRFLLNLHNSDLGPTDSASVFVKGSLMAVVPGGPFRVGRDQFNEMRCQVNISQVLKQRGWVPKRAARMRVVRASVKGRDGVVMDMSEAVTGSDWEE